MFEAATQGASRGLVLAANVGGMLIAFISLKTLLDDALSWWVQGPYPGFRVLLFPEVVGLRGFAAFVFLAACRSEVSQNLIWKSWSQVVRARRAPRDQLYEQPLGVFLPLFGPDGHSYTRLLGDGAVARYQDGRKRVCGLF